MADLMGFVEGLKRHHMFRVASWYATVAYVLILVANAVFPDIGLTRGEVRYLIVGLALGFPAALAIGWTFVPPSQAEPEKLTQWQRTRWRIGPALSILVVAFVGASGTYLWGYNERHASIDPTASAAQAVAILPFDHSGAVDDTFVQGLADQMDTDFSNIGVRRIANDSSPTLSSSKTPVVEIAKATGATLVIRGSVHRDDAKSDYVVYFELISATDGVTLDSLRRRYSGKADPADIQISVASSIAQRVHFLGVLDHYFAPGYPSTKDAGALQLFRRGMLTYMDDQYADGIQMLQAAVKLDPKFAQAHAYIAYFEAMNPDHGLADPKALVEQEIAAAEKSVPGLPEAAMARAASQHQIDGDDAAAARTLQPVVAALSNSFTAHMLQAHILKGSGHPEEAQREYQAAATIDPYNLFSAHHAAKMSLALRDYAGTEGYLQTVVNRWPLSALFRLDLAQARFSETGDLSKYAEAVDGDFEQFGIAPGWSPLLLARLEVAHFSGKHAEVLQDLKAINVRNPGACPDEVFIFQQPSVSAICIAPFTAETLRLLGKDQEAAAYAKLHAPEFSRLIQSGSDGDATLHTVNLALLQAFGGDPAALKTLQPILAGMDKPVAQWTQQDGHYSLAAAAVLAWSGEQQHAVDVLAKSLEAPYGAHAALVAIDPVWRPLYKTPAFAALLASHGVTLAHAP